MRNNDKGLNRPVLFILNDIWSSLNLKRKTQAFLIFCLMISSSIAEIASLGLIFPYLIYLQDENVRIPVQVNGKIRAVVEVSTNKRTYNQIKLF